MRRALTMLFARHERQRLAAFALAWTTLSWRAFAGPQQTADGVRLSCVRTESASLCPDAGRLEADVTQRLGRSPFTKPARASIEVAVSRTEGTWKAEIEMRALDGSSMGSRTVTSEASSCASLASAASLAIALMIDPHARSLPVATGQTKVAGSAARPGLVPGQDPTPSSGRSSASITPDKGERSPIATRGALALAAAVASDVLPRTSVGVGIVADVSLGDRIYATVGGTFFPEQRVTVSGAEVAFSLTWGALGPCYRLLSAGRVELGACASLILGAMHSVVLTPVPWQIGQQFWAGATAGPRLTWSPGGPFEIRASFEALAPVRRRSYAIERVAPEPNTVIFTEPAVSVIGSVSLGLRY